MGEKSENIMTLEHDYSLFRRLDGTPVGASLFSQTLQEDASKEHHNSGWSQIANRGTPLIRRECAYRVWKETGSSEEWLLLTSLNCDVKTCSCHTDCHTNSWFNMQKHLSFSLCKDKTEQVPHKQFREEIGSLAFFWSVSGCTSSRSVVWVACGMEGWMGFVLISSYSLCYTVEHLHNRVQNSVFMLRCETWSSICDASLTRCGRSGFHISK